jgi:hypothetical protein
MPRPRSRTEKAAKVHKAIEPERKRERKNENQNFQTTFGFLCRLFLIGYLLGLLFDP